MAYRMFYLNSRRNLIFRKVCLLLTTALRLISWIVSVDRLSQFHDNDWILIPDDDSIREAHEFVKAVLLWRLDPESHREEFNLKVRIRFVAAERVNEGAFYIQWTLGQTYDYRLIPLTQMSNESILRARVIHDYPFCSFPDISCHITPIFAIIDAGRKISILYLKPDDIAHKYHIPAADNVKRAMLGRSLTIVCDIWSMFQDAKVAAKIWEDSMRMDERKRNPDGDEIFTQSSGRTTQSAARTRGGKTDYDGRHMRFRFRRKSSTAGSGEVVG